MPTLRPAYQRLLAVVIFLATLSAGVAGALAAAGGESTLGFFWFGGPIFVVAATVFQLLIFDRVGPPLARLAWWQLALAQAGCAALTLAGWIAAVRVLSLVPGTGGLLVLAGLLFLAGPASAVIVYGLWMRAMRPPRVGSARGA